MLHKSDNQSFQLHEGTLSHGETIMIKYYTAFVQILPQPKSYGLLCQRFQLIMTSAIG